MDHLPTKDLCADYLAVFSVVGNRFLGGETGFGCEIVVGGKLKLLLRKSRLIFAPRFLAGEELGVARRGVRPQRRAPLLRRRLLGPGRYCSPPHRVPSISRNEGSNHLKAGRCCGGQYLAGPASSSALWVRCLAPTHRGSAH